MNLIPERLIEMRKALGINKTEAATMLNMSAMGYGRYERGERTPSYQTLCYIADKFNTSAEYLCGISDVSVSESITVHSNENPDLFILVERLKKSPDDITRRLLEYLEYET